MSRKPIPTSDILAAYERCGTYTAAARELGCSVATVSKRIKEHYAQSKTAATYNSAEGVAPTDPQPEIVATFAAQWTQDYINYAKELSRR